MDRREHETNVPVVLDLEAWLEALEGLGIPSRRLVGLEMGPPTVNGGGYLTLTYRRGLPVENREGALHSVLAGAELATTVVTIGLTRTPRVRSA